MQTETQATSHAQPPYTPSSRVRKQIETNFVYHSVKPGQQERYVAIRAKAKELAELIAASTPESREQSMAISDLENAMMWANAAIARNEGSAPETC